MRLVPLVPFNLLNYALGLTRISLPAYVLASLVCMLPGAIAYTWLGYAGRSAASGDMSALRYGLLGLGVLAMIAFVPRLFRRFRAKEAAWIEFAELQRRLAAGDPLVIVDVRQPEEFTGAARTFARRRQCAARRVGDRTPDLAAHKQPIIVVCKTDRRSSRCNPNPLSGTSPNRWLLPTQPGRPLCGSAATQPVLLRRSLPLPGRRLSAAEQDRLPSMAPPASRDRQ